MFREKESGLRCQRSTTDVMSVVIGLQELSRVINNPLVCFIDLRKAYGSVDRTLL